MRDVATCPLEKYDGDVGAEPAANGLFEIIDPICRERCGTRGGMAGEVHNDAERLPILAPCPNDADIGIDRPRVSHDVRVAASCVGETQSVLHPLPAVE